MDSPEVAAAWKDLADAETCHDKDRACRAVEDLRKLNQLPIIPAPRASDEQLTFFESEA